MNGTITEHEVAAFDELLAHVLDLAGMTVSASADAVLIRRATVRRTVVEERSGRRWARVELGDDERVHAELLFCEQGLLEVGWIENEREPEVEALAVRDRGGEREILLLLEPGQLQPDV